MHRNFRMVLSFVAVTASSLVLLADSTNECAVYEAFDVTYDYVTDCFQDEAGTLRLYASEHAKDEPRADEVTLTAQTKGVTFRLESVSYATDGCNGGKEGRGRFGAAALEFHPTGQAGAYKTYCSGWKDGTADQTLQCAQQVPVAFSMEAGVARCTLKLTRHQ